MWWRWGLALVLAGGWVSASAQTRGWLRYADGNAVSGVLVERTAAGGVFQADRFGRLGFTTQEARFEAEAAGDAAPPPTPPAPAPAPSAAWLPAAWSVGVSGYWQRDNGSITSDMGVDLDARWQRPRDEVQLSLSTDYKVVDDEVDRNEQSGSLRWMHTLASPWFSLARVQAKRSTFTLDPLPTLDYLLLHATVGGGWRRQWAADSYSLVALGHDRITLKLLRRDRSLQTHAMSLLFENRLRVLPRVTLSNTLYWYRWADGGAGFDSDAEVGYDLSDRVSVGLRHEYRRNDVNLTLGTYSRLSLTTRVGF